MFALIVAGLSLLWRNFRYDDDNPIKEKLDALPYFIKKPITCGVCFTFWFAFFVNSIALRDHTWWSALGNYAPSFWGFIVRFFGSWMILGVTAAFIVYSFVLLFEISHVIAHKVESLHRDEK